MSFEAYIVISAGNFSVFKHGALFTHLLVNAVEQLMSLPSNSGRVGLEQERVHEPAQRRPGHVTVQQLHQAPRVRC